MADIRRPQFTLRTLFAATSGCALLCGYLRWTGRDGLALAVAMAVLAAFVPVPLAFAASVAIDGWRPTLSRWNLRVVLSLMGIAVFWVALLAVGYPAALRLFF